MTAKGSKDRKQNYNFVSSVKDNRYLSVITRVMLNVYDLNNVSQTSN